MCIWWKCILGDYLTVKIISYPSGRFEAYTYQYRERSLLSKALNNQMIALYSYITQSLVLEAYTVCE